MEQRITPSAVSWDGGGGDLSWGNSLNWNTDAVPAAADDVLINFGANDFAVDHSAGSDAVNSLTSYADLAVTGGELLVAANSHLFGALTLTATFGGSGTTTVDGVFDWTGTLQGVDGQGSLTAAGGTTITGTVLVQEGFHFTNPVGQSVSWTSGSIHLRTGGAFINDGLMDIQGDNSIDSNVSESYFENTGTLVKSGGTEVTYFSASLNNSGLLDIQTGELQLLGGGTSTGTFSVNTDAALQVSHFDLRPESVIISSGSITLEDTQVRGSFNATGTTSFKGAPTTFHPSATVLNIGSSVTSTAYVDFSSGEPINTTSLSFLGAGLQGSDTINVSGLTTFVGGEHSGTGVTNAYGGLVLQTGFYLRFSDRTLNIWGEATLQQDTYGIFYDNSVINIHEDATLDVQGDVYISAWGHLSGTLVLNNAGVIRKIAGLDLVEWNVVFNNSGLLEVQTGELWLQAGGTSTGTFSVNTDAALQVSHADLRPESVIISIGSITLEDTQVRGTFNVTGTTSFKGGPTTFHPSSTVINIGSSVTSTTNVDFSSGEPINTASLTFLGGLQGSDTINVSGLTTFVGGEHSGTGTTNAYGGLILDTGFYHRISGRTLNIWENATFLPGTYGIFFDSGVINIHEGATLDVQGNVYISPWGHLSDPLVINNEGTIRKTAGIDVLEWYVVFNNTGLLEVQSGELSLLVGGTSTGTFSVNSDAALTVSGAELVPGSQINVAGSIALNNSVVQGTFNVTGSTHTSATTISGTILDFGNLTVEGGLDLTQATFAPGSNALDSLTLLGTLITDENLTVSGPFEWNSGTLQGANGLGSLTVLSNMMLDIDSFARDFHLINAGNAIWTGGSINFYGDSKFTNAAGATFDIQVDGNFGSADDHCMPFYNNGLLIKSGGPGTTVLHAVLYNSGTVDVQQGIIQLTCGYVAQNFDPTPPGVEPPPGEPSPPIVIPGPVPLPPVPLPVYASYTQTVSGVLIAQLAGHTPPGVYGVPGVDYGQVSVAGDVKLAGSFQVHLLNGFVPAPGDQFLIINNQGPNQIDGIFAGLPEGSVVSDGAHTFLVTYQGGPGNNDFVLTVIGLNSAPTANAGGPYSIGEGQSLTLNAGASMDPDGDSLTYTWDINGDSIFGDATGVSPTLSWAQFQALGIDDGSATFHPRLRVDDGHAHTVDSATTTLTLSNTAPVAGLGGPTGGVTGQACSFLLSAIDASLADLAFGFTYTINWHDGSPLQVVSPSADNGTGVSVSHTFATSGTYSVEVTATDKDGGISNVVSRTVNIVAMQFQGNDLVIGGTNCDDEFAISTGSQPGKLKVKLNGSLLGDFYVTGSILIFGGLGDDSITVTGTSATDDFAVNDSSIVFNAKNIVGDSICAWQVNAIGDNDTFAVYGGSALLKGGAGNDAFSIYGGAPTVDGGGGNDSFTVYGGSPAINSGSGNDAFTIFAGTPVLNSGSGDDTFAVLEGSSAINSGAGSDVFTIYAGSLCVDSGSGDDSFAIYDGLLTIESGSGNDAFTIYNGTLTVDSGSGDDTFAIYAGSHTINSGSGNDAFTIYNGTGSIEGANGDNSFVVYSGAMTITVGSHKNAYTVYGGTGTITGGNGDENFVVYGGATTISAAGGNDSFRMFGGSAAIDGGDGNDTFALYGTAASILGGAGNDQFNFFEGANVLGLVDGGVGTNALDYSACTSALYVNLTTGTATGTGSLANIRNVTGGQGNDILIGDDNDNILTGLGGKNLIIGGRGKDTLRAGTGGDILIGGYTSYDANAAALNALFSTWKRTELTYVQRVAALQTGVAYTDASGPHQAVLNASTVFDDAAADALFGGAGVDWFFARLTGSKKDTLNDLQGGETVTNI